MSGHRQARLGEEIRQEIAGIIARSLKDPRLGFVTVTRVELSPDYEHVRVYVGVLGEGSDKQKTLAVLQQAAGFVRRELGRRVRLRHTPDIQFRYDKGLDAADRVARLLDGVRGEGEGGPSDDSE